MELRKLITNSDRRAFAECRDKARSSRGIGFGETRRSRLGDSHLRFGQVYAIFEGDDDPSERMRAGFIMHDLATLPLSFSKPSVENLPPDSVVEGSDLWSSSKGAGIVLARAAAAVAGLLRVKAIVLYPIASPVNLASFYAPFGFTMASPPIKNAFGEALDGSEIRVQPLILQGENLQAYIRWGLDFVLPGNDGDNLVRLDASKAAQPAHYETSDSAHRGTPANAPASLNEH